MAKWRIESKKMGMKEQQKTEEKKKKELLMVK